MDNLQENNPLLTGLKKIKELKYNKKMKSKKLYLNDLHI